MTETCREESPDYTWSQNSKALKLILRLTYISKVVGTKPTVIRSIWGLHSEVGVVLQHFPPGGWPMPGCGFRTSGHKRLVHMYTHALTVTVPVKV